MPATDAASRELASTGKLRVAIAVGPSASALWTVRDPATGKPKGVPVELGTAMAQKLGVPVELVEYASSGEIVASRDNGAWDVTFVPVDDDRKKVIDFGAPYHLLQSTYLVAPGSAIKTLADANRAGVRIAIVDGTATGRASVAASPNATTVKVKNPDEAVDMMSAGKLDAIALSRESVGGLVDALPGSRVLDGGFPQFDDRGGGAEEQAGGARLRDRVHRGGEGVRPGAARARRHGIEDVAGRAGRHEGLNSDCATFSPAAVSFLNFGIHAVMTALIVVTTRRTESDTHHFGIFVRLTALLTVTVTFLMCAHVAEIAVWAGLLDLMGIRIINVDAFEFAFENYTALGYGDALPNDGATG